ncbi:hypothetical protein LTR27_004899 [Elasticomyces elasticus]|nr:hypothetical protein LTR27_004899 [Elasticomyces elasticus]
MASTTRTVMKATTAVPLLYRVLLQYIEPLFTLGGIALVLMKPEQYLQTMTRGTVALARSSDWLMTELAGGWMHFAFTEVVVLRLIDDLRVWKLLCIGMLLSDLAYTYSLVQAVGGWAEWVQLSHWTSDDWMATILTLPFVLTRVAILAEVGLKTTHKIDVKQTMSFTQ